jgi:RNA polymerase sigma-70 factor, ECF subfamily
LLRRAGRPRDALAAYAEAIALVTNDTERAYLVDRRDRLTSVHDGHSLRREE